MAKLERPLNRAYVRRAAKKKTQRRTRSAPLFLRFTDEELARLRKAAGEFPFAAWCRTTLLKHTSRVSA